VTLSIIGYVPSFVSLKLVGNQYIMAYQLEYEGQIQFIMRLSDGGETSDYYFSLSSLPPVVVELRN
jgi:hypothetical protein